jgi:hypothetical protein
LALAGAVDIVVPNMPDLGQVPRTLETGDAELIGGATALSMGFNDALSMTIAALEADLGIDIIEVDTFDFMGQIITDPASHNLTNVTERALAEDGTIVPNPDEYLFWDEMHPTTVVHAFLADHVCDVLDACVDCLADEDCAEGESCNTDTGECEAVPECISDDDCDDGQFCNGAEGCVDGECVAGDDPCPGQLCDDTLGACADCLADDDCEDDEVCNTDIGECEPAPGPSGGGGRTSGGMCGLLGTLILPLTLLGMVGLRRCRPWRR